MLLIINFSEHRARSQEARGRGAEVQEQRVLAPATPQALGRPTQQRRRRLPEQQQQQQQASAGSGYQEAAGSGD